MTLLTFTWVLAFVYWEAYIGVYSSFVVIYIGGLLATQAQIDEVPEGARLDRIQPNWVQHLSINLLATVVLAWLIDTTHPLMGCTVCSNPKTVKIGF